MQYLFPIFTLIIIRFNWQIMYFLGLFINSHLNISSVIIRLRTFFVFLKSICFSLFVPTLILADKSNINVLYIHCFIIHSLFYYTFIVLLYIHCFIIHSLFYYTSIVLLYIHCFIIHSLFRLQKYYSTFNRQ